MNKLRTLLILGLLWALPALAQPQPWNQNGSTIFPVTTSACLTFPASVTSGCRGVGTINAHGLYVDGVAVATTSGSVASISFSGTGLTPATATTGAVTVAGILNTTHGGLGANNSAATGIPVFAAGVATVTTATGSGAPVRATAPTVSALTVTGSFTATGLVTNADLANPATTVNGQTCTLGSTCTVTASATTITVSSTIVSGGTSGYLLAGGGGGALSQYAGSSCTNQVITALSQAAAATCSSITNAYLTAGSFTNITGVGTLSAGTWNATTIGLAYGGTNANLSATGGTSQFLKQASAGAAITVVRPTCSDLSDATSACSTSIGTSGATIPLLSTANTWTLGQTFSANVSTTQITETYVAPTISSNVLTIDLTTGTVFNVSNNANISTFTITGATASKVSSFTLILTANGSGYTQAWGSSVKWPAGAAPTLTTTNTKKDILAFVTNDGGTTWYGFVGGQNY